MTSKVRIIGPSNGTLDPGEPRKAIGQSLKLGLPAIELSALRILWSGTLPRRRAYASGRPDAHRGQDVSQVVRRPPQWIHISELTSSGAHLRTSLHAAGYLQRFLRMIPIETAVIVESVLGDCRPIEEVRDVSSLLGEPAVLVQS